MHQLALKWSAICGLTVVTTGGAASAQDLPRGDIVEHVQCQEDASQGYALYLPTYFDRSRQWPVILVFDAGGRGRTGVERYRAAAEKYGYILAGSNNSRNGPWNVGMAAAAAMATDVQHRFPIDPKRLYTAGMSGGARVAIMVAQSSPEIAGVFASSAGYSNAFHKSERFPIFGSAGTEDFNYREMRAVEALMTSPHRVEVFEGGHEWLPSDVATRGVEWMEIEAMKTGLRARDRALIAELFSKRMARANARPSALTRMRELKQIVEDFEGLSEVAQVIQSAAALEHQPDVARDLRAEKAEDARELRVQNEADALTRQLGWPERAIPALVSLKSFVASLLDIARRDADSSERRIARRVLSGLRASRRSVPNEHYQEWMGTIQWSSNLPSPVR